MSIQGYLVGLSSHSYRTPNHCASCMGARETEVKAQISEKNGNIRTTLTMGFPYCNACAKRAGWEKIRNILVGIMAATFGVGLALTAWGVDFGIGASIRFAILLPLAVLLAFLFALVTRQSEPAPPATARGEAVILRDTSGTVLCTNPQFAELLAQANGTTARPGSHWFTAEAWAPLTALLVGTLVLLYWLKAGAPENTEADRSSPAAAKAAAHSPQPAKKPAPPAPQPKKK